MILSIRELSKAYGKNQAFTTEAGLFRSARRE